MVMETETHVFTKGTGDDEFAVAKRHRDGRMVSKLQKERRLGTKGKKDPYCGKAGVVHHDLENQSFSEYRFVRKRSSQEKSRGKG